MKRMTRPKGGKAYPQELLHRPVWIGLLRYSVRVNCLSFRKRNSWSFNYKTYFTCRKRWSHCFIHNPLSEQYIHISINLDLKCCHHHQPHESKPIVKLAIKQRPELKTDFHHPDNQPNGHNWSWHQFRTKIITKAVYITRRWRWWCWYLQWIISHNLIA